MNWILTHQLLVASFFATLFFIGMVMRTADQWEKVVNHCHHAPSNPKADEYCGYQCINLVGLLIVGLLFLWELI